MDFKQELEECWNAEFKMIETYPEYLSIAKACLGVCDNVDGVYIYDIENFDTKAGCVKCDFTFNVGYSKKKCEPIVYDIVNYLFIHHPFSENSKFMYKLLYYKDIRSWKCKMLITNLNK